MVLDITHDKTKDQRVWGKGIRGTIHSHQGAGGNTRGGIAKYSM